MNDIKQIYELALEVAKNLNHVPGIKKMELDGYIVFANSDIFYDNTIKRLFPS